MEPEFTPIDLNLVERIVTSYVHQRDALIAAIREGRPTHLQFIVFCNSQSSLLNQALGTLDENGLRLVLQMSRIGAAPMPTDYMDAAFEELLMTQIAYLAAKRARISASN